MRQPLKYESEFVLRQLQYAGVMETIRIRREVRTIMGLRKETDRLLLSQLTSWSWLLFFLPTTSTAGLSASAQIP